MDLQIATKHLELLGKPIESKLSQYWEQSITSRVKTFDDFIMSLTSSETYQARIREEFANVYTAFLNKKDYESCFNAFIKENRNNVNKTNVIKYVSNMKEYKNYISSVVGDILNVEYDYIVKPEDIDFFLTKASSIINISQEPYSTSMIYKDIEIFMKVRPLMYEGPTVVSETVNAPFDFEKLDDFENVFQRPMYVQEYFKYASDSDWETIHEKHKDDFEQMRAIFQNYTGKSISEYYFIKKYLSSIDSSDFFQTIINDIVDSNEYKNGMISILSKKYESMFDLSLDADDCEYIFAIVKDKKMPIISDDINSILSKLKEETDEITSNIFKLYMDVLDRPPELIENVKYIAFYRKRKQVDKQSINSELEKILIGTLEFHEILKSKIKRYYRDSLNSEIPNSVLYDTLNKILSSKLSELTIANSDSVIQKMLG